MAVKNNEVIVDKFILIVYSIYLAVGNIGNFLIIALYSYKWNFSKHPVFIILIMLSLVNICILWIGCVEFNLSDAFKNTKNTRIGCLMFHIIYRIFLICHSW